MIITYYGKQFFKVQSGDKVLAFDPMSGEGKKSTKFGADIGLLSINHTQYNQIDNIKFGDKDPFIISDPGDYEVNGVYIQGFPIKTELDDKKRHSIVYLVGLEDMNLLFLGPISSPQDLTSQIKSEIDTCDVLFVPVGGDLLKPAEAYKLSLDFSAKVIIPMNYDSDKDLSQFLKEGGEGGEKPEEKLVLKKRDLADKECDIVLLKDQSS